jgi:transcriptional regulator with XRE-family HTH domain
MTHRTTEPVGPAPEARPPVALGPPPIEDTVPDYHPGGLLRLWRERRRLTQHQLADQCGLSLRDVTLIESGQAMPGPSLLLLVSHRLDLPLREINLLLDSAGHRRGYPENRLDSPQLTMVDEAVRKVLAAHEPYPAVVVDRYFDLIVSNTTVRLLTDGVAPWLLAPPMNLLRLILHPDGLGARLLNRPEWTDRVLGMLRREVNRTADERLSRLYDELAGYSLPPGRPAAAGAGVVAPLQIEHRGVDCALFCASSLFGAARDITVSELTIESFFPADEPSAAVLREDPAEPDAAHSWWWTGPVR